MKYILIGTPNVGKTTIGKLVANQLKIPFFDIDEISKERIVGQRFSDVIFDGGQHLMSIQKEIFFKLVQQQDEDSIISTSAALPVDGNLYRILASFGTIILIKRNIEFARKSAKEQKGMLLKFSFNGIDSEEIIDMNLEAVNEYASDLPMLEEIAHFQIENNDSIAVATQKLIDIIKEVQVNKSNIKKTAEAAY